MDRILHVEDDPGDAHLIGQRLRAAGLQCEIVVVDQGEAFRAEVAKGGYALVISDCGLPGLSVRDALDFVRASNPNLPFICLSGAHRPGTEQEMLAAGADDYILKNNMERLITAVRRGLAAGRVDQTRSERYAKAAMRLVADVQRLSMARELATVQAIVRRTAREIAGADGATFILREGDRCYYVDEDAIAPLWKGQRFPMSACVSGWVMLHAQPAVITNIYEDPRVPVAAYRPTFVKSMAMVPIRSAAPIGAIGAYWARLHSATREEVELLQALANATAVTMENIQVYAELERRVEERTSDLRLANADPDLMEAVVENLLSNAWKYSSRSNPARIEFTSEVHADGSTAFVVRDNGIGFELKQADRLFRPFQRLHRAEDYPGTGVGLATVKRIVERHGGSISLESAPGRGTTVHFTLGA